MTDTEIFQIDLAELLEAFPEAVYTCDTKGKITFFNKLAVNLWGRSPEIDKDIWCGSWKIYNADGTILDKQNCQMANTLMKGEAVPVEEIIIERHNGKRVHVLVHAKPIFNTAGAIVGGINTLIKKSESQDLQSKVKTPTGKNPDIIKRTIKLQESENRYHKMIEEVEDYAILLLDSEGNVQNWNLGAQKIKGYTEQEIVGKNFSVFYLAEDRNRKLPQKLIEIATRKGKATHEGWRLKKSGEKFWGFVVLTALHDDQNNIIGFSKVTRDLTERKLFEDQLEENAKSIEFRNKQLEEYAHIASHDLQEPLRKIRIFAEMLSHKIEDKNALKDIAKIESAAERMTHLIKDVLAYSEIAQGQQIFAATDLNEILSNVEEDCELWIQEKNITIEHNNLPVINAIPIQMHQLFSNLITNALKYSYLGGTISVFGNIKTISNSDQFSDQKTDAKYVELLFKDNGKGFDSKYSNHIFKLFQRLNNSEKGMGIGLALCKKIIENHKGNITVKSEVGIGTEFIIHLPINN